MVQGKEEFNARRPLVADRPRILPNPRRLASLSRKIPSLGLDASAPLFPQKFYSLFRTF